MGSAFLASLPSRKKRRQTALKFKKFERSKSTSTDTSNNSADNAAPVDDLPPDTTGYEVGVGVGEGDRNEFNIAEITIDKKQGWENPQVEGVATAITPDTVISSKVSSINNDAKTPSPTKIDSYFSSGQVNLNDRLLQPQVEREESEFVDAITSTCSAFHEKGSSNIADFARKRIRALSPIYGKGNKSTCTPVIGMGERSGNDAEIVLLHNDGNSTQVNNVSKAIATENIIDSKEFSRATTDSLSVKSAPSILMRIDNEKDNIPTVVNSNDFPSQSPPLEPQAMAESTDVQPKISPLALQIQNLIENHTLNHLDTVHSQTSIKLEELNKENSLLKLEANTKNEKSTRLQSELDEKELENKNLKARIRDLEKYEELQSVIDSKTIENQNLLARIQPLEMAKSEYQTLLFRAKDKVKQLRQELRHHLNSRDDEFRTFLANAGLELAEDGSIRFMQRYTLPKISVPHNLLDETQVKAGSDDGILLDEGDNEDSDNYHAKDLSGQKRPRREVESQQAEKENVEKENVEKENNFRTPEGNANKRKSTQQDAESQSIRFRLFTLDDSSSSSQENGDDESAEPQSQAIDLCTKQKTNVQIQLDKNAIRTIYGRERQKHTTQGSLMNSPAEKGQEDSQYTVMSSDASNKASPEQNYDSKPLANKKPNIENNNDNEQEIPSPSPLNSNRCEESYSTRRRKASSRLSLTKLKKAQQESYSTDLSQKNQVNNKASNTSGAPNSPSYKYCEVVRKKDERRALPGRVCPECNGFFDAVCDNDVFNKDDFVGLCSRHRSRHTPPQTPDNFWDLSFIDEKREKLAKGGNESIETSDV